jgi:hypothetical protein
MVEAFPRVVSELPVTRCSKSDWEPGWGILPLHAESGLGKTVQRQDTHLRACWLPQDLLRVAAATMRRHRPELAAVFLQWTPMLPETLISGGAYAGSTNPRAPNFLLARKRGAT